MDAFDLLGLPRRPWLDPAAVRAAFQSRARELHPDAAQGDADAFARLNSAHREIERPASRLRLLVGAEVIPATPPDFALGFELGAFLRKCDAALAKHRAARSPLATALVAGDLETARRALTALAAKVQAHEAAAGTRLRDLDAAWPEVPPVALATLAGTFTFLDRWSAQLRERELELRIATGGS